MPATLANKLRLGIIGCGWATANLHVPALRRIPQYELIAVADMDRTRVEEFGSRWGVRYRFGDARALIEHSEVDAVAVCVPPGDHASVATAAIKAGKHVFIEKPLTLTVDHADRLLECASGTRAKVLVGFNLRWHRLVRQAKAMLNAHRLGPLILMRTVFTNALCHDERIVAWRRHRSCGGGVIQDLAVHHFDLWRYLLASEVQEISVSARSERWQDEAAVISARMTNGMLVSSVFASGTSERHELECYGEAGSLSVSCYHYDGLRMFSPRKRALPGLIREVAAKAMTLPRMVNRMRSGGEISASYESQWRHFLDCVQTGAPVGCSVLDGKRAVELAVAATESLLTGQSVSLKQ
ncbi:MAG TPA: Gfo/Idh/MocA family oxidoreductase [Nitrospiraceae bacterium]|nr:Gfo/Idh/MocA family oxidoreductase [Nitrospiraceae bacterium]